MDGKTLLQKPIEIMSCFGFILIKQNDLDALAVQKKKTTLVGVILSTIIHRVQKTNGCSCHLWEREAWLTCAPSWTALFHLDIHIYPSALLPVWIPVFPLNSCFTGSKKKFSGRLGVKFNTDGGSLVFPLVSSGSLSRENKCFSHGFVSVMACCSQITFLPFLLSCSTKAPHCNSHGAYLVLTAPGHPNFIFFKEQIVLRLPPFWGALTSLWTEQSII